MKLPPGAIIGIVFGIICAILICIGLCWFAIKYFHISICCFGRKNHENQGDDDRESGNGKEMSSFEFGDNSNGKNKNGKERQVGDDIK